MINSWDNTYKHESSGHKADTISHICLIVVMVKIQKTYNSCMIDQVGLKNHGYTKIDVNNRRTAVENFVGTKFEAISDYRFDPIIASKNIENMIGTIQIPLGYAGPITIFGDYARGNFLVPLATTEGALIASISRGMSAISESNGVRTCIFEDYMTRAPIMRVNGLDHSKKVIEWIRSNMHSINDAVSKTTIHGKLHRIDTYPNGKNLFLRCLFETGDAMGMNMVTIATESICQLIEEKTGAIMISVSGNMCSDKKPAAINMINGRGKTVVAEASIYKDIV